MIRAKGEVPSEKVRTEMSDECDSCQQLSARHAVASLSFRQHPASVSHYIHVLFHHHRSAIGQLQCQCCSCQYQGGTASGNWGTQVQGLWPAGDGGSRPLSDSRESI